MVDRRAAACHRDPVRDAAARGRVAAARGRVGPARAGAHRADRRRGRGGGPAAPASPAAGPARLRVRTAVRLLPAVLLSAAARLWYLGGPAVQFNADEATTGLMVREIGHGRHFVFYAGQQYGGSLEQYLKAAGYLLVPMPQTAWTLRLPLVALSVVTCVLVFLLAERVLGSPARATVAAVLFAVSPWFSVLGSVTSLGFYVAGQTLCAAVLYGALRVSDGRGAGGWLLGTGLCAGLAVWTSLTSLYLLVPAAL